MTDFDALLSSRAQEQDAVEAARAQQAQRAAVQPRQELTKLERLASYLPASLGNQRYTKGLAMGMADPAVGGAQLLANVLPDSTGVPQAVNKFVGEKNREYEALRGPDAGFDVTRTVGNVLSPANLAIALRAAPVAGAAGRAIQGAGMGAAQGALAPVEVGEKGAFWDPKVVQTGVGAAAGAVFAPIMGAVSDKVGGFLNARTTSPQNAAADAERIVREAVREAGQKIEDVPIVVLDDMRSQVTKALSSGKQLDAAAALRKADFQAEGIAPTLGQITRDPMQWASEQNVRGITGVGEPVMMRLAAGNQAVMKNIGNFAANAQEGPAASQGLAGALREYGATRQAEVGAAYRAARDSAGKELEIPMQGLAQDYADVAKRFDLPGGVKRSFEEYGLLTGKQGKTFNFEDADKLRKVLSDNADPANRPLTKALGELRGALDRAQLAVAEGGGPFAPAVKKAAAWFKMQDEIPALKAAISGDVDDAFVRKYVIGNRSTEEVQKLANVLRQNAPEAFEQTRAQIGEELASKAFGANVAGDKAVSQEAYNRALKNIGTEKLKAFFTDAEVDQMKRLGRIAAYQQQPPAASASNYANTASALANVLRKGSGLPIGGRTLEYAGNKLEANAALNATTPAAANLTPKQRALLAQFLAAGSGGLGSASATGLVGQ